MCQAHKSVWLNSLCSAFRNVAALVCVSGPDCVQLKGVACPGRGLYGSLISREEKKVPDGPSLPSEEPLVAKGLSWCVEEWEPEIVFISWVKMSAVVSALSVGVQDTPLGREAVGITGV